MTVIGVKRRNRDGNGGVWDWELEHDCGSISRYVERDVDDYRYLTLAGLVIAPSDEDKEKIEEIPDLPPVFTWMFPKLPGEDPVKRRKVWEEVKKEGLDRYGPALNKLITRWKREEALVAIKDVNLGTEAASSCSCGEVVSDSNSDSDSEVIKDKMVVDQGSGSSSHLHLHSRL